MEDGIVRDMQHVRTGFRRLKMNQRDPWEGEERVDRRILTEIEDLDLIHLNQDPRYDGNKPLGSI